MNKLLIAGVVVVAVVLIFLGLQNGQSDNEDDPIRETTITTTTE